MDHPSRILDYAAGDPQRWRTLHRFVSEVQAQLCANELEVQHIRYQVLNGSTKSTLSFYGAMVNVDLQVLAGDFERASIVLKDFLQPELTEQLVSAEPDDDEPIVQRPNSQGEAEAWHALGTYDSVHAMREAALILEAGRIESMEPTLVARTAETASQPARFVLRVREHDRSRAARLLSDERDEVESEEPQCPRCGGWNVYLIRHEVANLFLALIGKSKPTQIECLKCHYIGTEAEFSEGVSPPLWNSETKRDF